MCEHELNECPDECDGPHASWAPVIGKSFKPLPDSKMTHGPGMKYKPNGDGSGQVSFVVMEHRKGFRPGPRARVFTKYPRVA